jgi:hypothetical protein
LYLAGAKILTLYPVSIPAHGMALNMTVQSYQGSLDFGLTACRRSVPELGRLAGYVEEALQELHAAVIGEVPAATAVQEAAARVRARPKTARTADQSKPRTTARKAKPLPPAGISRAARAAKTARP